MNNYEKYFMEIVSAIQKKTPIGANNIFTWATTQQPELYAQQRTLYEELNALWGDDPPPTTASGGQCPPLEGDKGGGLSAFKAKVLAWGRTVLLIYKKYTEAQKAE